MEEMRAHRRCALSSNCIRPDFQLNGGNMNLQKLTPNYVVRDVAASMEF